MEEKGQELKKTKFKNMPEELIFHVPSYYFNNIACYCKIKAIVLKGSSDIIAVCTTNGQVIEFSNKKVLQTCEVNFGCKAERIMFFASYNPFCTYYVVKFASDVYIVIKENTLKVFCSFNKVRRVKINDFLGSGSPQLGIWYSDRTFCDQPHYVTDLTSSSREQQNKLQQNEISSSEFPLLYNKCLQGNRIKHMQLKENLETKRQIRFRCTQHLIRNQLEDGLPCQDLICVLGEKQHHSCKQEEAAFSRLGLQRVWQKVHNDKWIIGIQVTNKGKSLVQVEQLLLKATNQNLTNRSHFLTKRKPSLCKEKDNFWSLTSEWYTPASLCQDELVTAIATLKLSSCLLLKDLVIHGVILYKVEDDTASDTFQLPIPDIVIDIEEYMTGSYSLFLHAPAVSEEDFLSILVTSQCFELQTSHSLSDLIVKKYGFLPLLEHGRYYSSNKTSLDGIFVEHWLECAQHHLIIYSKNVTQTISFIHCLQSNMPAGASIIPAKCEQIKDRDKWYKSLKAEINFTSNWLLEQQKRCGMKDENISVSKNEYFKFRSSLCRLEKETDESEIPV